MISINYRDYNPPHFHARYGEQEITMQMLTGVVEGVMSRRALGLVFEWADLHRGELLSNWERARNRQPLVPVEPLS